MNNLHCEGGLKKLKKKTKKINKQRSRRRLGKHPFLTATVVIVIITVIVTITVMIIIVDDDDGCINLELHNVALTWTRVKRFQPL